MQHFYGIYLEDSMLSTAFDLIRFLGEPDGIRFSHITLRGPLSRKLAVTWLNEQNTNCAYDWRIKLTKPGRFMSDTQATVFIQTELGMLAPLWQKPDFPQGLPHMTLYDGKSQEFATKLRNVLARYEFDCWVNVTKLRMIQKKFKVDEVFHASFEHFYVTFSRFLGDPRRISKIRYLTEVERINLIEDVLSGTFRALQFVRRSA